MQPSAGRSGGKDGCPQVNKFQWVHRGLHVVGEWGYRVWVAMCWGQYHGRGAAYKNMSVCLSVR